MFYQTVIQSVSANGIVDTKGKKLICAGNKIVQEGDLVWTDGQYIFGHTPIRGGSFIPTLSGIPILGEKNLTGDGELRGYLTKGGKFKKYSTAKDGWITNSDKKFAHGEEEIDDVKVIDAYINKKGEKVIMTGGIYQDSRTFDLTGMRISIIDNRTWGTWPGGGKRDGDIPIICERGGVYKQTLGSESFPNDKIPAKILVDDKEGGEIDLEPYAKDIEKRALQCAEKIMEQSHEKNDANLSLQRYNQLWLMAKSWIMAIVAHKEYSASDIENYDDPYVAKPPPDEPFIAYTTAYIQTGNIGEDGFSGIIFASTYGYCFPYIQPRFKIGWHWRYDDWDDCFKKQFGTNESGSPKYPADMLLDEWKCVPFGCSAIYKVTAGESEKEPVIFREFGGVDSDVMIVEENEGCLANDVSYNPNGLLREILRKRHVKLKIDDEVNDENNKADEGNLLSVGNGFYWMDKFGRLSFYDSEKNKIAENIPVHDDFLHIEIEHGEYYADQMRYDKHFTPEGEIGDDNTAQCMLFFNDKPYLHCKFYTSDGETENKIMFIGGAGELLDYANDNGEDLEKLNGEQAKPYIVMYCGGAEPEETDEEPFLPMDGYYIKKFGEEDKTRTSNSEDEESYTLEPLQFTPLFMKLKNGSYLYGVKGGKLYFKEKDGEQQEIGDGVKNFRLQELKNIGRARK